MSKQVTATDPICRIIAPHIVIPVYLEDQIIIEEHTPVKRRFSRQPASGPYKCLSFADVHMNRHKRYLGRFVGEDRHEVSQKILSAVQESLIDREPILDLRPTFKEMKLSTTPEEK